MDTEHIIMRVGQVIDDQLMPMNNDLFHKVESLQKELAFLQLQITSIKQNIKHI